MPRIKPTTSKAKSREVFVVFVDVAVEMFPAGLITLAAATG